MFNFTVENESISVFTNNRISKEDSWKRVSNWR